MDFLTQLWYYYVICHYGHTMGVTRILDTSKQELQKHDKD